jgi:hypothetical protein
LLEGVGSVGLEHGSVSALTGSTDVSQNWELKAVLSEQVGSWSSDFVLSVQNHGSDD